MYNLSTIAPVVVVLGVSCQRIPPYIKTRSLTMSARWLCRVRMGLQFVLPPFGQVPGTKAQCHEPFARYRGVDARPTTPREQEAARQVW